MKVLKILMIVIIVIFVISCSDGKNETIDEDIVDETVTDTDSGSDSEITDDVSDTGDTAADEDIIITDEESEDADETVSDEDSVSSTCADAAPETDCASGAGLVEQKCINDKWTATPWCCYKDAPEYCSRQFQAVDEYVDKVSSILADEDGTVYVAGTVRKSDYDPADIYFTYFKGDEEHTSVIFGDAEIHETAAEMIRFGEGFLIAGTADGAFNGGAHGGGTDIILINIDKTGAIIWSKQIGQTANEDATSVTLLSDGSIVVAGLTDGPFDGHDYIDAGVNMSDPLLIKFDKDGKKIWSATISTENRENTNYSQNPRVTAGAGGAVFIAGATLSNMFETNLGSFDAYIAKFSKDGDMVCSKQFGTDKADSINAIISNGTGVIMTGSTEGAFPGKTSGGTECMGGACQDVVVITSDENCAINTENLMQFGSAGHEAGHGMAVNNGKTVIAAHTNGLFEDIIFAGEDVDKHEEDLLLVEIDGSTVKTTQIGSESQWEYGLAAAYGDTFYMAGQTPGLLGIDHPAFAKDDIIIIRIK